METSGTHFDIGPTMVSLPTWSFTTRTCPAWPGNTYSTLARGQWALGLSGEMARTTSPILRSGRVSFHFWQAFNNGNLSFNHLFQQWKISSWTLLHLFFGLKAISSTDSGADKPSACPWRKWFGVSGVASLESADWYVRGREFSRASTPINVVINSSSLMSALLRIARMAFWRLLSWLYEHLQSGTPKVDENTISLLCLRSGLGSCLYPFHSLAPEVLGPLQRNLFLGH